MLQVHEDESGLGAPHREFTLEIDELTEQSTCNQMRPPGRKVYQRGSYTIWEVDGANSTVS